MRCLCRHGGFGKSVGGFPKMRLFGQSKAKALSGEKIPALNHPEIGFGNGARRVLYRQIMAAIKTLGIDNAHGVRTGQRHGIFSRWSGR